MSRSGGRAAAVRAESVPQVFFSILPRRGERAMTKEIQWEKELDQALARAKRENRPVLLFFHNPE